MVSVRPPPFGPGVLRRPCRGGPRRGGAGRRGRAGGQADKAGGRGRVEAAKRLPRPPGRSPPAARNTLGEQGEKGGVVPCECGGCDFGTGQFGYGRALLRTPTASRPAARRLTTGCGQGRGAGIDARRDDDLISHRNAASLRRGYLVRRQQGCETLNASFVALVSPVISSHLCI